MLECCSFSKVCFFLSRALCRRNTPPSFTGILRNTRVRVFNVWHLIDAIGYWVTSRSPSLLRLRKYRWCGILIYRLNDQSHSFLFVLLRALFVGSSLLLQLFFLFPVVESSQRMIRMTSSPFPTLKGASCVVCAQPCTRTCE